jgi:DNA-binding transcriptional LysR family regulator
MDQLEQKMKIRRLEALRAVIELGSITEAAHNMNLTQPGVSRLIASLEAEIGFRLFNRTRGRLQITEQGETFFQEVEPLLMGIDQIPSIASEIRQHRHSRLHLVTLNSQAHSLVPLALKRFCSNHRETAISVTVRSRRELIHWTGGDHFDLAVAALPLRQRQFEQKSFTRFSVVAALPADHPLCQQDRVSVADLAGENLISLDPFAIFQQGVRARFQELGIEPETKIQTTSMLLAGQMVSQGLGIALIDPFIAHTLRSDEIEVRPLSPAIEYEYGYVWPVGRSLSPLAKDFAEAISDIAAELSVVHMRSTAYPVFP